MAIDGVDRLRAFAKAKRLRVSECCHSDPNALDLLCPELNAYLDSLESRDGPRPYASVVLTHLGELASEILVERRATPGRGPRRR